MQLPFNFILLFLLFTCANSQAQSDSLNQQKYWDYRDRLTGKDGHGGFLDVGEGPGMSLAASERNPFADCEWDWYLRNSGCKTRKGKGRLHWGDASLYHGFYLAVLALEYVNLERAGQKVDEVSSELWFALKTVERLDSMAEVLLGYPGKLDGFFVRDDVYADFHYKKNSPMKRRFVKDKVPFDCLTSSAACGKMNVSEGGFISQDQVIGLFIGFSAIQQLIPDKRHKDSLPSFGDIAALNAHRITSYMLCNKWKLKGPDGTKIPDEWGGNTIGMSYPVARIANQICNQRHRKSYMCKGAKTWGLPIYDLLHFSLAFQHQTNVGLALMSLALLPERRYRALGRKSIRHDVIIYPLIRSVFYNQQLFRKITKADFEVLLNSAPPDGPCFDTEDCEGADEWKSFNRWVRPRYKNGNPFKVKAETPGLDYMLLYNLYHYYYSDELPVYKRSDAF